MDKTQKERILHALQRLEQNVGKVSFAVTIVMFNLPSIISGTQQSVLVNYLFGRPLINPL